MSISGGCTSDQVLDAGFASNFPLVLLLSLLKSFFWDNRLLQLSVHLNLLGHHLHLLVHRGVNTTCAHVTVFHFIVDFLIVDVYFHARLSAVWLGIRSLRVSRTYDVFVRIYHLTLWNRLLSWGLLALSHRSSRWLPRLNCSWGPVLNSVERPSWRLFLFNCVQRFLTSNQLSPRCWNWCVDILNSVTLTESVHHDCSLSCGLWVCVKCLIFKILDAFVS